jgi:hypothetical protein
MAAAMAEAAAMVVAMAVVASVFGLGWWRQRIELRSAAVGR